MVTAEQVRSALRTSWLPSVDGCVPLSGGMNSATWQVQAGDERFVAKVVPAGQRSQFEAGLAVAERLDAARISAGAPVRAADGALSVAVEDGRLALLRWVPGRELDRRDPIDQQFWGDALAAVHRALAGFTHPGLTPFHSVRPDRPHLAVEPWVRPAVASAVAAVSRLRVTDQLTYGVLHGDPSPTEFRLDIDTGRVGLLDWGSVGSGPLTYDLASAVMYAGGLDEAGDLLDGYLSTGVLHPDECDAALPTMLRFRWAVQADYFAYRISVGDMTGISSEDENWQGLHHARDAFRDDVQ